MKVLIYKSSFKVVGEEILKLKIQNILVKFLKELIEKVEKLLYYVAKTLDFILIKVEDDRKERKFQLKLKKY